MQARGGRLLGSRGVAGEGRAAPEGPALPAPVQGSGDGGPGVTTSTGVLDALSISSPTGGPSLLDTRRITRPGQARRSEWLNALERETDAHRIGRAQEHWRRAALLKAARLKAGRPLEEAIEGARWHQRRAYGHINRFLAVADCGVEKFWLVCLACDLAKEKTKSCRVALLCVSCRSAIGEEKRARFRMARKRALQRTAAAGLHWAARRGGRWSEKLLTLTMPHLAAHNAKQRIENAFRAWSLFRKAFKRQLADLAQADLVAWFRTFEWTPGSDGKGHPHFHIWLLCPYVDKQLLDRSWKLALRTAGFPKETVETVITHIQIVDDGEGAAREVIKYLTKDILPNQQLVEPHVFGLVYQVLDGRRTTQASSRFFSGIDDRAECECGATGAFRRTSICPEPRKVQELPEKKEESQ